MRTNIHDMDGVQTRSGGVTLYIKSSLNPVRLQLDTEASHCVGMICCRISTFPPCLLFTETSTNLPQTINLCFKLYGVRALLQENVLLLVTLMPTLLTGELACVLNWMVTSPIIGAHDRMSVGHRFVNKIYLK